ncbi:hypothetical protein D3C80_1338950 [compost metagenome]
MRHGADIDVEEETGHAKIFVQQNNLLCHVFGVADIQSPAQAAGIVIGGPVVALAPAAFTADDIHLRLGGRVEQGRCLFSGFPDKAVRMGRNLQLVRIVSGPRCGFLVQLHQRGEAFRHPADDGKCNRKAEHPGPDGRLGITACSDPYRQGVLYRTRIHRQVVNRRTVAAAPGYLFGGAYFQQQLQIFFE